MSRPVEPSVLALWRRFAEANGFVALAKIVCVDATALFGLRQCSIGLHDPDGRPFIVVDNVREATDEQRLAWVDGHLWRLDPLLAAMREHRGPVGDEVVDPTTFNELAHAHGYTGEYIHTLLLPLVEPGGLIGSIRCGRVEPFPERMRRDLVVVSTDVSVRLAQLGVTTIADAGESLSPRQREIAQLAARGRSNLEIADTLTISENTVKKRLKEVFFRLDVSNRTELSLVLRRSVVSDAEAPLGIVQDGVLTITRGAPRATAARLRPGAVRGS